MKHLISSLLCLVLLIGCTGCSSSKSGLSSDHLKIIQEHIDTLENPKTARICGDVLVNKIVSTDISLISVMMDTQNSTGEYTSPHEFVFADQAGKLRDVKEYLRYDGQVRITYQFAQAYQAAINNTYEEIDPSFSSKDIILQMKDMIKKDIVDPNEFTIISGEILAKELHVGYVDNNESLDYRFLDKHINERKKHN